MTALKDRIITIQSGDILNPVTLNAPVVSLAEEVQADLDFINLDNNKFTDLEKTKLRDIESNAQKNVNSDWSSTEGDSRILNKPTIGSIASKNTGVLPDEFRTNQQNEELFVSQIPGKGLSSEDFTVLSKNKVDLISISAPVNLDEISSAINGLASAVIMKGVWSADSGAFPSGLKAGYSYIVSNSGIVDGVDFQANDRILALVDNASSSTYQGQWLKLDYTDQVLSVAGKQGNVELNFSDISGLGSLATLNSGTQSNEVRTNSQAEAMFVHQASGQSLITAEQSQKLDNIEDNAQKNVKADWNSTGDSEILNKPVSVSSPEAIAGSSNVDRLWSPEKVHEAARAVSAKIGIISGTLDESAGGKILVTNSAVVVPVGLPLGWNVIIAATGATSVTLSGAETILETNSNTLQLPRGYSVSATKITSSLWLIHQLRLQLRAGL